MKPDRTEVTRLVHEYRLRRRFHGHLSRCHLRFVARNDTQPARSLANGYVISSLLAWALVLFSGGGGTFSFSQIRVYGQGESAARATIFPVFSD